MSSIIYSQYIPITTTIEKITVRNVVILRNWEIINGRWISERQTSIYNLIRSFTIQNEKNNSILIVHDDIERLVNELSDFEIRMNEWVDHDIDEYVEYFGYIRSLKIHCFRINFNMGVGRTTFPPLPPLPPHPIEPETRMVRY